TEDRSSTKPGLFDLLVERFRNAGLGTIRFDFRGHGRSAAVEGYVSIQSELADLRNVVSDAGRRNLDVAGMVACSFGACATSFFLTEDAASSIRCACLVNPVIRPFETFLEPGSPWAQQSFTADALAKLEETGLLLLDGEFPLGAAFVRDIRRFR